MSSCPTSQLHDLSYSHFQLPPPPTPPLPRCARCIHLQKDCSPNCITAPYFPARMVDEFLLVCRYFNIGYIEEQLRSLSTPHKRQQFVDGVICEALYHGLYRHGFLPVIRQLQDDIISKAHELRTIRITLAYYRSRFGSGTFDHQQQV